MSARGNALLKLTEPVEDDFDVRSRSCAGLPARAEDHTQKSTVGHHVEGSPRGWRSDIEGSSTRASPPRHILRIPKAERLRDANGREAARSRRVEEFLSVERPQRVMRIVLTFREDLMLRAGGWKRLDLDRPLPAL